MRLWKRLRLSRQPDGTSPWWGIAILLVGVVLVLLGYLWEGTWEDVFIEVGAAAGVGGIVLLFKPRLMRQVGERAAETATTTAEAITTSRTEALEERLVRLESISDIQAGEQDRQQEEANRLITAVSEMPSYDSVFELLTEAAEQRLFLDGVFVRTNERTRIPLLQMSRFVVDPRDRRHETVQLVSLLFHTFEDQSYAEKQISQVSWSSDMQFADLVQEILRMHVRLNMPTESLDLEESFQHLQRSYQLMIGARLSPPTSHQRLQGSLIFLINDEWALTSAGLEATQSHHIYSSSRDIQPGISNKMPGYKIAVDHDSPCPDDCQSDLWTEAKFYAMLLTALRR